MAKINILPAKVYNRIAAGEVVDRPYSVVKELVENAIDAGATEIEIYIEKGGKQLVRVVDNGCGIERDDLQSAFLPHATSKISTAEDLDNIMTLGFRGEAIASIAAVSKTTITSKVKGQKCYALTSNGGELGQITESSGMDGTEVAVEMLFFNAPVRLNFLKADKSEETDITTFVSRFILNRSDISFSYFVNGKKVLQSFGGGEEEAFVCIYGAATHAKCIQINGEKNGVRVRGYIGNQNYSKPNKTYQCVFLNGRYVLNATIASAIMNAYTPYLMKRQYPFYVLHIIVPPQIVDVNVHPNKADVRFADNRAIYGAIYSIISAVLDGKPNAIDYIVNQPQVSFAEDKQAPVEQESIPLAPTFIEEPVQMQQQTPVTPQGGISEGILSREEEYDRTKKTELKERVFEEEEKPQQTFGFATFTYEEAQREIAREPPVYEPAQRVESPVKKSEGYFDIDEIPDLPTGSLISAPGGKRKLTRKQGGSMKLKSMFPDLPSEAGKITFHDRVYEESQRAGQGADTFAANKRYLEELELKATQDKIDVSSCVYAGKLFNTYLLYECGNDVYMIDQHAAHERLIYNRLREKMRNRSVVRQPMLLPYELHLNAMEAAFLREKLSEISEIGFDIKENGINSFSITAIPVDLQHINLEAFFNQVLAEIDGYRGIKMEEVLKDKLATTACKAAVKGGMDLTTGEALELLKQMDGDMSLKCPHGRPVVIKLTRADLEKLFKRIV